MTTHQLALADELAAIRAEIARLKTRETTLQSIQHNFPKVPVFRRPSQPRDTPGVGAAMTTAHA
jgi:hypothetical protein